MFIHKKQLLFSSFRLTLTRREQPSSKERSSRQKCVICGMAQHRGESKKYRIEDDNRANLFLRAATQIEDDVYTQVADLEDKSRVFAGDIVYHNACMSTYLKKYESLSEES